MITDFRFRILDFGFWISYFGFQILYVGFQMFDFRFGISDFEIMILGFQIFLREYKRNLPPEATTFEIKLPIKRIQMEFAAGGANSPNSDSH